MFERKTFIIAGIIRICYCCFLERTDDDQKIGYKNICFNVSPNYRDTLLSRIKDGFELKDIGVLRKW